MPRQMRSLFFILTAALLWAWACSPSQAEPTPKELPEHLGWPWPCGESYRISSTPEDHWANGKGTGLAYDFSMIEGTPLFAPASGHACFLTDERDLETNYGNYVEIILDGDWMVRLAHLRDPQSGERHVEAGEFLGYSGRSGVDLAHLHLELLRRQGDQWVCPETSALDSFFGVPMTELVEGAYITNRGCPPTASLAMQDDLCPEQILLGERLPLTVSIWNDGILPLPVEQLDVVLTGPDNQVLIATASEPSLILGKQAGTFAAQTFPQVAGEWHIVRLTLFSQGNVLTLQAQGQCQVVSPELMLHSVQATRTDLGHPLSLTVSLMNASEQDLDQQVLVIEGTQPDGAPWFANSLPCYLQTGMITSVALDSTEMPWAVGNWRIDRVGLASPWGTYYFALPNLGIDITGPRLAIEQLESYASTQGLTAYLIVANRGNRPSQVDALEVWAWPSDDSAPQLLTLHSMDPLQPGEQRLVRLYSEFASKNQHWQIGQAAYWFAHQLVPIPILAPDEPKPPSQVRP